MRKFFYIPVVIIICFCFFISCSNKSNVTTESTTKSVEKIEDNMATSSTNQNKATAKLGGENAASAKPMEDKAGTSTKPAEKDTNLDEERIIVLLPNKLTPDVLTEKFKQYNFVHQGRISRTENLWIFTYDTQKITPQNMLDKIKETEIAKEAYFAKNK